jgi:membrane peptidoglycan carboxypeptidase
MKPRIIDHIDFPSGKTIEYKDEIVRRVIKKSTSDILTSMLNSSINE